MGITLSGSLDITGSLFVNGTAVSTGSGGSVPASVTAGANIIYNIGNWATPDYTIGVPAGPTPVDVHISQSGVYLISGSFATTESGSVNLYYYPDDLAAGDNAIVYFTSLGAALGTSVRFIYQGIISGSASQKYYTKSSSIFGSNQTLAYTAANTQTQVIYRPSINASNPTCIYKINSTDSYLFNINEYNSTGAIYTSSGSIGTPIV